MERFTERDLKDIKKVFSIFDKDSNGTICTRELSKVLRSMGQKPTEQEVKILIAGADKDGNGTINFKEFLDMVDIESLRQFSLHLPKEDEIRKEFKKFDKDGNGFISVAELRQTLNSLNVNADMKLTEFEALQLVQKADTDGDSRLNYEEFIRMMYEDDD